MLCYICVDSMNIPRSLTALVQTSFILVSCSVTSTKINNKEVLFGRGLRDIHVNGIDFENDFACGLHSSWVLEGRVGHNNDNT